MNKFISVITGHHDNLLAADGGGVGGRILSER